MPRLTKSVPAYRKHKASGQAFVELSGQRIYLGPHGTKVSHDEYDRQIAEYLANGRRLKPRIEESDSYSLTELIDAYDQWAEKYYVKNGKTTATHYQIRLALRVVYQLYGKTPCSDFGPLALKAVRHRMIKSGLARGVVNQRISIVCRMFKWGASEQLVSVHLYESLRTVEGLKAGRSEARETAPIKPISDEVVNAALPFMPKVVADMVRLERLAGMRPSELCSLRPLDIDRSEKSWVYNPQHHKTEHFGKTRTIMIGPKGRKLLTKYLKRDATTFCFRPCDSEAKRRDALHAARKTPLSCGNRPGRNRKAKPKKIVGTQYSVTSYRQAIQRACDKAFPHPSLPADRIKEFSAEQLAEFKAWRKSHRWAPNQLRHTAATEVRRKFGVEAAQSILGHANVKTTEIYAERNRELAMSTAESIG